MLLLRLLAKSSRGGGGLHRLICGQKKVEWLPFPLRSHSGTTQLATSPASSQGLKPTLIWTPALAP